MTAQTRLAALLLITLIPACGKESAPTPTAATPAPSTPSVGTGSSHPQIAFIPLSPSPQTEALHAGVDKALSEFKKGLDGKPVIDLLWQSPTDKSPQPDLAQALLKTGIAAIIIQPDNQAALNAITTAAAPSRIPVIAINSTLDTSACKSTINFAPDSAESSHDFARLSYTAVKTAGDCLREKKVEKQILISPLTDTPEHPIPSPPSATLPAAPL